MIAPGPAKRKETSWEQQQRISQEMQAARPADADDGDGAERPLSFRLQRQGGSLILAVSGAGLVRRLFQARQERQRAWERDLDAAVTAAIGKSEAHSRFYRIGKLIEETRRRIAEQEQAAEEARQAARQALADLADPTPHEQRVRLAAGVVEDLKARLGPLQEMLDQARAAAGRVEAAAEAEFVRTRSAERKAELEKAREDLTAELAGWLTRAVEELHVEDL